MWFLLGFSNLGFLFTRFSVFSKELQGLRFGKRFLRSWGPLEGVSGRHLAPKPYNRRLLV